MRPGNACVLELASKLASMLYYGQRLPAVVRRQRRYGVERPEILLSAFPFAMCSGMERRSHRCREAYKGCCELDYANDQLHSNHLPPDWSRPIEEGAANTQGLRH